MARSKPPAGADWSRRFDVPIILPDGGCLETLADARAHLLTIPKVGHTETVGEAALALVRCAEGQWDMMLANGWMGRVVYGERRAVKVVRKKRAKVFRIVR